nr:hypothetical protein [Planomonospora sp. ID91781]
MLKGSTTASYFWDDGSGRAGDTGLPASGKPMQKGLAASPSWPLMTEGYVVYKGKKAPFFVGDRGPGEPSTRGIMLDLDAKTFADLTGGTFDPDTLTVRGNGGLGHIEVDYVITAWGSGVGKKNHPVPFSTRAWSIKDTDPAEPMTLPAAPKAGPERTTAPPVGGVPAGTKIPAASPTPKQATGSGTAASSTADDSGGIPVAVIVAVLGAAAGGTAIGRRLLNRRLTGRDGSPAPRRSFSRRRARGRHRSAGGRQARLH